MKRSNFLKSLLISIISPKVVVEALKEEEPAFKSNGTYNKGLVFYDGPPLSKEISDEFTGADPNKKFVAIKFTEHERAKKVIEQLIAKHRPNGVCINIDALYNIKTINNL